MGWHLASDDFEFMMELEPKGCFVLLSDIESVGLATTISFDKIGWFGNLIVDENYRRKGAGSLLVKHSIEYLKSEGVETVCLYAYMDRISFYRRLGFDYDSDFTVLKGKGFPSKIKPNIRRAGEQEVEGIIDYDRSCLGVSRRKLLEPIILYPSNLCYVFSDDGQISGYAVAKVYDGMAELGPLVCPQKRKDIAVELLKATLNDLKDLQVSMCVLKNESSVIDLLRETGFSESFNVAKMYLGPLVAHSCTCFAESLERG
jgi:predicted GNAT family acetyltransferase